MSDQTNENKNDNNQEEETTQSRPYDTIVNLGLGGKIEWSKDRSRGEH